MVMDVLGKDLRVGDVIAPWGGRTTTITGLLPYTGALKHLWNGEARIAMFNNIGNGNSWRGSGMTIEPNCSYTVVKRTGVDQ